VTKAGTARVFGVLALAAIAVSAAVDAFFFVWLVADLHISLSTYALEALEAVSLVADVFAVIFVIVMLLRLVGGKVANARG